MVSQPLSFEHDPKYDVLIELIFNFILKNKLNKFKKNTFLESNINELTAPIDLNKNILHSIINY